MGVKILQRLRNRRLRSTRACAPQGASSENDMRPLLSWTLHPSKMAGFAPSASPFFHCSRRPAVTLFAAFIRRLLSHAQTTTSLGAMAEASPGAVSGAVDLRPSKVGAMFVDVDSGSEKMHTREITHHLRHWLEIGSPAAVASLGRQQGAIFLIAVICCPHIITVPFRACYKGEINNLPQTFS